MDDAKHSQLKSLVRAFVSTFLKNGKSHERIIVVGNDFEARMYVSGKMLEQLEEVNRDIEIVEARQLPRDFKPGRDYAIDLNWYLEDRRRTAFDFLY
jgi:hypothetical protein